MKESIEKHEERIRAFRELIAAKEKEIEYLKEILEIQFYHYQFYGEQIAEARRQGKTEFDSDRFMRSKRNG